jgi:hypothetical protein
MARKKVLQVWEAQTAEIESALRAAHINAGAPEPLGLITSVRCRIFSDCVLSGQFVTRFILNLSQLVGCVTRTKALIAIIPKACRIRRAPS